MAASSLLIIAVAVNVFLIATLIQSKVVPVHKAQGEIVNGPASKEDEKGTIYSDPSCKPDVETLCPDLKEADFHNDFKVAECLMNNEKSLKTLSKECHHTLWKFKYDISLDKRFPKAVKEICKTSLHDECKKHKDSAFISCMIEFKESVEDETCKKFLTTISSFMFSDFRFVEPMLKSCKHHIHEGQCGKIASQYEKESDSHTQGAVLECLMEMEANDKGTLDKECKHEILRLAELQADDYHQDRPLYFACREARERFCKNIKSGDGRVFECLIKHKFERGMPGECVKFLTIRQKFFAEDIKVDRSFIEACTSDIKTHCRSLLSDAPKLENTDHRELRLYSILHCLGEVSEDDPTILSAQCAEQVTSARKQLMSDYQISPEIVRHCEHDIVQKCGKLKRNGETLHCLMKHAMPSENENFKPDLSKQCANALSELLEIANLAEEDIEVDPVLGDACQDVFDKHCQHKVRSNRHGIDCLLELLPTEEMAGHPQCEAALLQVQFFAARNFKIDHGLYQACKADAAKSCNVKKKGHEEDNKLVMPCLYRELNDGKLSRDCARELKHVMRLRSVSIDLQPEIEEACITDLGKHCSQLHHNKPGAELKCLEENYADLESSCKNAVKQFVEIVEKDPEIDQVLMEECMPYAKKHCAEELANLRKDDGADNPQSDLLDCMIRQKDEMSHLCQLGLERYQLLALNDWHFSPLFAEECGKTILKLCKAKETKADVIRCLSDKLIEDVLGDKDPSEYQVPRTCRQQLKAELMAREEKLSLDPELQKACASDLKTKCYNVRDEDGQKLECLKDIGKKLTHGCYEAVFKREELEAIDPKIDLQLRRHCGSMIKKYCPQVSPEDVMDCMADVKDEDNFDARCQRLVVKRLRQDRQDIHLKPALFKACLTDIKSFCGGLDIKSEDIEDKILTCLRNKYLDEPEKLSARCEHEMSIMMRESVIDIQQDPILQTACKEEINDHCNPKNMNIPKGDDDQGKVEECLRGRLMMGKIRSSGCKMEVSRIVMAGRADMHVDPLLYRACAPDIEAYCKNIPLGQGRKTSCLLNAMKHNQRGVLTQACEKMLKERSEMWKHAAEFVPAKDLGELWTHVTSSPSSSWFFLIASCMFLSLLLVGIVFGRTSKRLAFDLKSK